MFGSGLSCICMCNSRETLCPLYSDDRAALHLVNVTNVCPLLKPKRLNVFVLALTLQTPCYLPCNGI